MDNVKFTLIIPAYNVEKYIYKCIESVISQSYTKFEVILVNDGSTDNTGIICDEYSKKDKRIKVIHKENGGLSDARNKGLENASGNYIIFVDGDDYISKDTLSNLNNKVLTNPDIVITRLVQVYDDADDLLMDEHIIDYFKKDISKYDAIDWVFNKSENTWPAPKYIISHELIKKYNIRFKDGFLHEDLDWTMNLFYYANKFEIMYNAWYFHRMGRKGSITSTSKFKRATDVIIMVYNHINDSKYSKMDIETKEIMFNRAAESVYRILSQYKLADKYGKKEIIKCLNNHKEVLKYTPCFRHKVFSRIANLIGIEMALNIMSILNL